MVDHFSLARRVHCSPCLCGRGEIKLCDIFIETSLVYAILTHTPLMKDNGFDLAISFNVKVKTL